MCPNCRQEAPLVYRGVMAYCAACGAPRVPLTGSSVNLAGRPSRVGGVVARGLGWAVLAGGIFLSAIFALLGQWIWPAGYAGYLIGGPVALLALALSFALLRAGRALRDSGRASARGAQENAVHALAAHRGGTLTALDVSQALGLSFEEADALLTGMAKTQYERVTTDIDPSGTVVFNIGARAGGDAQAQAASPPRTRVAEEIARSPNRKAWEQLEADEAEATGEEARARGPGRR